MVAPNPLFLRDADVDRALELLWVAERNLVGHVAHDSGAHALSAADYRTLYFIARRPELTPAALARLIGVSRQAVSRHLQRLSEAGLVMREATNDGPRKLRLQLTATARANIDEIAAVQRRHLRAAFKKAGTEAVEGFVRVLAALSDTAARRPIEREAA
jgi:DNA-binding MarR family transcriptional regulator